MNSAGSNIRRLIVRIVFGPFILDLDTRQVTRGGREMRLTAKAFDLLAVLALDRPKVLSKAVLQERLWPATFVAEANLSNLVAEIRAPSTTPRGHPCTSEPRTDWAMRFAVMRS